MATALVPWRPSQASASRRAGRSRIPMRGGITAALAAVDGRRIHIGSRRHRRLARWRTECEEIIAWPEPMRSCWAPASSAPRPRCIWPSAGLSVALVDRRGAGRGDLLRQRRRDRRQHAVSACLPVRLRRAAADRAQAGAGGELSSVVPAADRALAAGLSRQHRAARAALAFAEAMRPLFARARERARGADEPRPAPRAICARTAGSSSTAATTRSRRPRASASYADKLGLKHRVLERRGGARARAVAAPVFRHAVHWPDAASVSNPLAVTKAYAAQFVLLGGVIAQGRRAHAAPLRRRTGGSTPTRARSTPRRR